MVSGPGWGMDRDLSPGRVVRDAYGRTWRLDTSPRWTGTQLRVRARLIHCDGVWGDLPVLGLEPLALTIPPDR